MSDRIATEDYVDAAGGGSGLGAPFPVYPEITGWYAGNSTFSTNSANYFAFWVEKPMTVTRVMVPISTQAGNIDVGIYAADGPGGGPGTRLCHTGSIACPASSGTNLVDIPDVDLAPGKYWVAIANDDGGIRPYYHTLLIATGADPDDMPVWLSEDSAFPLPATASASPTVPENGVTFYFFPLGDI